MKNGVSMLVVTVAISVMVILIGSSIIFGSQAIQTAQFEEFVSQLNRLSVAINDYVLDNNAIPTTGEVVSGISLGNEFMSELVSKKDENNRLFVVNISLLKDGTIKRGSGTAEDQDIFVVAENTNNVYYVKGFRYKGKIYFGQKVD